MSYGIKSLISVFVFVSMLIIMVKIAESDTYRATAELYRNVSSKVSEAAENNKARESYVNSMLKLNNIPTRGKTRDKYVKIFEEQYDEMKK